MNAQRFFWSTTAALSGQMNRHLPTCIHSLNQHPFPGLCRPKRHFPLSSSKTINSISGSSAQIILQQFTTPTSPTIAMEQGSDGHTGRPSGQRSSGKRPPGYSDAVAAQLRVMSPRRLRLVQSSFACAQGGGPLRRGRRADTVFFGHQHHRRSAVGRRYTTWPKIPTANY